MQGIANNLNREQIENINNDIMNIAVAVNFDDVEDKQRAKKRLSDLINQRKRLFEEGNISAKQRELRNVVKQAWPDLEIKDEYKIGKLRLDMYVPELNFALEYDGAQHYIYPNHIHKTKKEFDKQQTRDRVKDELCKQQGIKLIRIRYDEEISMKTVLRKVME